MDALLVQEVRLRAGGICEYCHLPEALFPVPFEMDHIIARKHAGPTVSRNLALSCLHCNDHKGPCIAGLDPLTGKLTRLFHPRLHKWEYHFRWDGPYLVGKTPIGRVTIVVLAINDPDAVDYRDALIQQGLYLPS